MGLKDKQRRKFQKERYEDLLAKRKAFLAGKGIAPQQQAKDKVVEQLQAEIKRTARAIVSITKMEEAIGKATRQKKDRAEKRQADRSKPKKKKSEAAPEEKGTKDKKEKKSDKKKS